MSNTHLFISICPAILACLCLSCDNHSVTVKPCLPPEYVDCQGTCIDPMTSDVFCGANADCEDFSVCAANHLVCNQGVCVPPTATPDPNNCLKLTDQAIQAYALTNWDTDQDDCISPQEAAAVTEIPAQTFKNNAQLETLSDLNQFPNLITIREEAFSDCPSLTTVELDLIKNIEPNAFNGSPIRHLKLTNIETLIDNFNDFSTLASIELPHLKTIKNSFSNCSLTSIDLPEVKTIHNAFLECPSLTSLNLPEAEEIRYAFDYSGITTLSLPKAITINAFERCSDLVSIDMPMATNVIGFSDLLALTSLSLPQAKDIIGFNGCPVLTSLSLPQAIHVDGFKDCPALTSLSIPEATSVTGFTSAESLTTIDLPKATIINGFEFSKALTSLTLPAAETINSYAFFCPTALETLNLPKAKHIGQNAFATGASDSQEIPDCYDHGVLTSLYLPEIESIGENAFSTNALASCIKSSDDPNQWACATEQWCKKGSDQAWSCQ